MLIAGEPSGDKNAQKLVQDLSKHDCEFYGMGGDKMQQSGVKLLEHIDKITVMGLFEVFFKLPFLYQTLFKLKRHLKQNPPDLLILIDFQTFNLKLAKTAKRLGIKTLFYIGPQVWAWREYRMKKLKKIIDNMAVIFPFELDFYQKHNMQVNFVGHPLLDKFSTKYGDKSADNAFLKRHNLHSDKKIISFFPGSRNSEIINHLPIFMQTIQQLDSNKYHFLLSCYKPNTQLQPIFDALPKHIIIEQDFQTMLNVSDFAVVASGTAVLESALAKTPMLVIAKVSKLNYFFYKRMIKTPFIAIVNIIVGRQIITELIQENANANNISAEIERILSTPVALEKMQNDFVELRQKLSVEPKQSLKSLVLSLLND